MLDGFNQGWLDFEQHGSEERRGATTLQAVVDHLVDKRSDGAAVDKSFTAPLLNRKNLNGDHHCELEGERDCSASI